LAETPGQAVGSAWDSEDKGGGLFPCF